MKIYTKTGDKGTTGLLTGQRVDKDNLRVEAYGNVDEINSALGLARSSVVNVEVKQTILELQKLLMSLMAELASVDSQNHYINDEHVKLIEETIDKYDAKLPALLHFLIPGESLGAAALDIARTTARRAERQVIRLAKVETVDNNVLLLLNRLSDLCFILSRAETEL